MRVESRDLVDLAQRELHLLSECSKMSSREMTIIVLNEMQVLDQQIALARARAEQRAHFLKRARINLPALRCLRWSASPARGLLIHDDRVHSEQPHDLSIRIDVDGVRCRHLGQAWHGHDVTADRDHELGTGGEANLAHRDHVIDGRALEVRIG